MVVPWVDSSLIRFDRYSSLVFFFRLIEKGLFGSRMAVSLTEILMMKWSLPRFSSSTCHEVFVAKDGNVIETIGVIAPLGVIRVFPCI